MNHDFRRRNNFCRWALLVALAYISLSAHALAPSKGYNVTVTPTGKNFELKYASDGTPLATIKPASGGVVPVTQTTAVRLGPLAIASVVATGVVTGASVGGAVGAAIGGLGALVVATLPGFQEMFARAGVKVNPDGTLAKSDPTVCSVAPCYSWQALNNNGGLLATFPSFTQACAYIVAYHNQGGSCVITEEGSDFHLVTTSGTYYYGAGHRSDQVPPNQAFVSATTQDVVAAITANAPTQEEVQALVDALYPPAVSAPVVTGPARVFAGNTVELLSPAEKRTVEEWKNLDYSTPGEIKVQTEKKTTVTKEATTSTTTTLNPDGSTSIATTTTPATSRTEITTDEDEKPAEDPCKLTPLRLGCLDIDTPDETPMPKRTEAINFVPVVFQSNATCPGPLTISGTLPVAGSFSHSLSYQGICNGAGIVRLFLLMGATIVGIGIFVGGLKS